MPTSDSIDRDKVFGSYIGSNGDIYIYIDATLSLQEGISFVYPIQRE